MNDQFLTIAGPVTGYFMEKGSKFLAYAFPVDTEAQASAYLQQVKKEHPKARHYCTALRLRPDASLERYADDGEPSGSAGRPILGQLVKHQLTFVFVIVVRYFGGTKLGIPGLIDAYKTSTADAIAHATVVQRQVYGLVRIEMPYAQYPGWMNHIRQEGIPVLEESFRETIRVDIAFPKSRLPAAVLDMLTSFSRLDFDTVEEYAAHLHLQVELLAEEIIR